MSFTFHPGRPKLPWGGCPVFDGMTDERCQITMKEKKVCRLCPEYAREKKRKYYIKEAFAALSLLLIVVGTANALGIGSVWHGMVYSPAARQYGTVQVVDETGQVVKTLPLKPFPNRSTTTAFANWSTPPAQGNYTLFFNLSSANGKVLYARVVQVDATATVNVDPKSFWNYSGGRTLTQSVSVNPGTLWNYTGARARKIDNLDAPVSGIAASVWGYTTRTLSGFGTLISDIWAWATRTVTGGTVTASNAPSAVAIDSQLSASHGSGIWGGGTGGTAFVNWSSGGDYFASRFGNGPWGAAGQFNIIGLGGSVTPPYPTEAQPITVKQGDTVDIPYTAGEPLAGKTVWFGGLKNPSQLTDDIPARDITSGVTDSAAGKGFIHLIGTDTAVAGLYICEVQVVNADGSHQTPVTFRLRIVANAIRR